MEMAREFSEIWTTGDPSPADRILAEDVQSSDVIYNTSGTQGRESWKQMIHGVFKVTLSCPCLLQSAMKTWQ